MRAASSTVVVNTGPLLALGACGRLDLLRALHARVIVPEPVADELSRGGTMALTSGLDPVAHDWVEVVPLRVSIPAGLLLTLDRGEASVIAFALELSVPFVLIDERRGRWGSRSQAASASCSEQSERATSQK